MKSQDVFILLKLICLDQAKRQSIPATSPPESSWSARGLASLTGVSKTEVNNSLNRSINSGLAIVSSRDGLIKANSKALLEFIVYGIRYVFPVKPAELTRGIPTAFNAPVLEGKLLGGDLVSVWPDAESTEIGQSVLPLYRTVPQAVTTDARLYAYLALVDAVRIGGTRERKLAADLLAESIRDLA